MQPHPRPTMERRYASVTWSEALRCPRLAPLHFVPVPRDLTESAWCDSGDGERAPAIVVFYSPDATPPATLPRYEAILTAGGAVLEALAVKADDISAETAFWAGRPGVTVQPVIVRGRTGTQIEIDDAQKAIHWRRTAWNECDGSAGCTRFTFTTDLRGWSRSETAAVLETLADRA